MSFFVFANRILYKCLKIKNRKKTKRVQGGEKPTWCTPVSHYNNTAQRMVVLLRELLSVSWRCHIMFTYNGAERFSAGTQLAAVTTMPLPLLPSHMSPLTIFKTIIFSFS